MAAPPSYDTAVNHPGGMPPPVAPGAYAPHPGAPYGAPPPPPPGAVYPPGQMYPGAVPPPPGQQKMMPPPPPGYQPVTQVVGGAPVVLVQPGVQGFRPVQTMCPFCQQQVMTRVRYEPGGLTWLAAGGIALMGCWLGCCLIPLCIDECKDAVHECPNCNKIIATKQRI